MLQSLMEQQKQKERAEEEAKLLKVGLNATLFLPPCKPRVTVLAGGPGRPKD